MHKSRHQSGDNRNDSDYRCGDTADSSAECCKRRFCTCDDSWEIGNKLHQLADTDHGFTDHHKQRSQCRRYQCDLDNGFLDSRIHCIELIHKRLNFADDCTDSRHKNIAKTDSKFL